MRESAGSQGVIAMHSTFTKSHTEFLAALAKAKPASEISDYPTAEEVLNIRDHLLEVARLVDAYFSEQFSEARYMASVRLPHGEVNALEDYLNDEGIEEAFNNAAVMFPRKPSAYDVARADREAA